MQLELLDQFPVKKMVSFLSKKEFISALTNDLSGETINFEGFLLNPDILTHAVVADGRIIGAITYTLRNPVLCECHGAFERGFRGKLVVAAARYSLAKLFLEKGILKVFTMTPADNRAALYILARIGAEREGVLKGATVRGGKVRDLIIMGVQRYGRYLDGEGSEPSDIQYGLGHAEGTTQ